MTSIRVTLNKWGAAAGASAFALILAVGCTGQTSLSVVEQSKGYEVDMDMDPLTLNPPQLGSLTYDITNTATGKIVTAFEPIFGSNTLMHTILIREDLEYMRHDTASLVVDGAVSVPAYFPSGGSYKAFTFYKPLGAELQQYTGRIVSGEANEEVNLAESGLTAQLAGGVRFDWVKGTEPIKAGEVEQLVFHLTERGEPVIGLGPVYGAPAHLWIVDSEAKHLWNAVGKAESRSFAGEAEATGTSGPASTPGRGTPSPSSNQGTSMGTGSSSDPVGRELPTDISFDTTPPTLVPDLGSALATVVAEPRPTLQPVQQTAQSSVLEPLAVPPAVGFGPTLVFEHKFEEPGLYKLWIEVFYRDRVLQTDWVVRVVE